MSKAEPKKGKAKIRELAEASILGLDMELIRRLKKDQRAAAANLTTTEVRYLVDLYYQLQEFRKASGNQILTMDKHEEPVSLLGWIWLALDTLEMEIKSWMHVWGESEPTGVCKWSRSICGIADVLSAGLFAHVDITRCPTVSHLWSFGGWNPDQRWEKGQKRPYNAKLKVLFWKIGESFMKVSANKNDIYGKIYVERKDLEWKRNLAGEFAGQAEAKLRDFKIGKNTEAYKWYSGSFAVPKGTVYSGEIPELPKAKGGNGLRMLPPGRIQLRAQRYAAKLFLAHWWEVYYRAHYGTEPPAPYPIQFQGHAHKIPVPNKPRGTS